MKELSYPIFIHVIRITMSVILFTTAFVPASSISHAATSSTTSVKQWTYANTPDQLEVFAEQTIEDLAEHLPFKSWKDANLDYTPLGPGTHSWLVTIEDNSKPLGYLIITSDDMGGYVLSEYGIGSELPYSLAPLEDTFVRVGLLKVNPKMHSSASPSLPKGSKVEALYSPISPFFKVTLKGKAPIYVHAVTFDIMDDPYIDKVPTSLTQKNDTDLLKSSSEAWLPSSVIRTDGAPDPYQNLKWLTTPALSIMNGDDIIGLLSPGNRKSLVFTVKDHNAAFGAPFNLTGWQSWSTSDKPLPQAIYVTIPQRNIDLMRFVPVVNLIGPGKFQEELSNLE